MERRPIVRHTDETEPLPCPLGTTRRVVTGGEGGVANVHVITVAGGRPHYHEGYDEVYYFLSGEGTLRMGGENHAVRRGTVAVIPRGTVHSLESSGEAPLEFVIFGVPPMSADDPRFTPRKPETPEDGPCS